MFERFTERAREVIVLSQDEARSLRHPYIGTEHLLLGLLREEKGIAAQALESLGVKIEPVRSEVARLVGPSDDEITSGRIPFTPRSKKVLELALREALWISHSYIGTEHILLGLVRENQGVASRILLDMDADAEKVRIEVLKKLTPGRSGGTIKHVGARAARRPQPEDGVRNALLSARRSVAAAKRVAAAHQDLARADALQVIQEQLERLTGDMPDAE